MLLQTPKDRPIAEQYGCIIKIFTTFSAFARLLPIMRLFNLNMMRLVNQLVRVLSSQLWDRMSTAIVAYRSYASTISPVSLP